MTGPLHHVVGGDAEGQDADDEGAAGVGADQFPLGLDFVGAVVALLLGGHCRWIIRSPVATYREKRETRPKGSPRSRLLLGLTYTFLRFFTN